MKLTRTVAAAAATVLVGGLGVALASAPTQAASAFKVTATVNRAEPEQGQKVKITGSVKPARPGSKVVLQKKYDDQKKWKTVATKKLDAQSKFSFKDKVDSVRHRLYRVVKAAEGNRAEGKSSDLGVTVFGWRYLTSLGPVAGEYTAETSNVNINAKAYPNSLVGYSVSQGSVAYNINRQCKRFESRVGLSDTSEITSSGVATLKADATQFFSKSFELTESEPVVRDVTGVFRLTFEWTSSNTEGTPEDQSGADVALGSPRLLCSF